MTVHKIAFNGRRILSTLPFGADRLHGMTWLCCLMLIVSCGCVSSSTDIDFDGISCSSISDEHVALLQSSLSINVHDSDHLSHSVGADKQSSTHDHMHSSFAEQLLKSLKSFAPVFALCALVCVPLLMLAISFHWARRSQPRRSQHGTHVRSESGALASFPRASHHSQGNVVAGEGMVRSSPPPRPEVRMPEATQRETYVASQRLQAESSGHAQSPVGEPVLSPPNGESVPPNPAVYEAGFQRPQPAPPDNTAPVFYERSHAQPAPRGNMQAATYEAFLPSRPQLPLFSSGESLPAVMHPPEREDAVRPVVNIDGPFPAMDSSLQASILLAEAQAKGLDDDLAQRRIRPGSSSRLRDANMPREGLAQQNYSASLDQGIARSAGNQALWNRIAQIADGDEVIRHSAEEQGMFRMLI